jgi:hypothetical protein
VTRVLPSLLLTDGSHAFSLCQNGEHRSKRSEIAGFNSNFAIALRCDAVYLTSARRRFVADRVIRAGLAAHGADREAAAAEVAAVVSRRRAAHHRDTGSLQAPQRPPWDLDHGYVRGHIPWPSLTSLCRLTVFSWSVLNACRHACDAMPLVQTEQLPR